LTRKSPLTHEEKALAIQAASAIRLGESAPWLWALAGVHLADQDDVDCDGDYESTECGIELGLRDFTTCAEFLNAPATYKRVGGKYIDQGDRVGDIIDLPNLICATCAAKWKISYV